MDIGQRLITVGRVLFAFSFGLYFGRIGVVDPSTDKVVNLVIGFSAAALYLTGMAIQNKRK